MGDQRIIDLYWARSDDAIAQSAQKYSGYCHTIAFSILSDRQDSEECVNDTWLGAWNAMPPHRPHSLSAFLGKITRRLACSRYRAAHAQKRGGGELPLALDELTLHLLSQGTSEHAQAPAFLLYVNESIYRITTDGDSFVILPALPSSELPPCDLTIVHRTNTMLEDEVIAQETELQTAYETVTRAEIPAPDRRVTLCASSGTDWDDVCCDVTVIPDGQDGVFVLTARYFTEAAEGHGVRFADIVMSLRPISDRTERPGWLINLQATTNALMWELFAGEDLGELCAYGENVRADLSIASVDYTIDTPKDPAHAVVSVRHRVDLEDSFNYLTIELDYADGVWNAVFAGIEK